MGRTTFKQVSGDVEARIAKVGCFFCCKSWGVKEDSLQDLTKVHMQAIRSNAEKILYLD